jgi:leader peptidase (prepilin peptidase)/N-methyltransferase
VSFFELFCLIWVFTAGLCLGSFLNVVVLRAFSGESIVLPPSKCPHCREKLKPWHNIPVFSYIFLRGKCAFCKEKISVQYPLVELFTGVLLTLIYYKFGLTLNTLFLMIAAFFCIVIAVCDLKEKVVFVSHTYILAALGLVYNLFNIGALSTTKLHLFPGGLHIVIHQAFIYSILGLITGFLVIEAISRLSCLITGKRAFGEGDSYIAGALGAFFGVANLLVILILSVAIQTLVILPIFLYKLVKSRQYRLFSAFLLFVIMAALIKLGEKFTLFDSEIFHMFSFALFVCIGLYCIKRILESLKKGDNLVYLPFGPALIVGAFIIMFST